MAHIYIYIYVCMSIYYKKHIYIYISLPKNGPLSRESRFVLKFGFSGFGFEDVGL